MDSAEIENLVGVVFIYLALFGFDYYIITTFRPKGSLYLLYYTILFMLGIYFIFYR
jgi:hypothetical protein